MYLDADNLYGWAMSQKPPISGFKWVEKLSRFNERFIKNCNENSDLGYFFKQVLIVRKNYLIFIKIYHFYQKEKKLINMKKLFVVQKSKQYICCS